MYNILKNLFLRGKISNDELNNAVKKGFITEKEYRKIIDSVEA